MSETCVPVSQRARRDLERAINTLESPSQPILSRSFKVSLQGESEFFDLRRISLLFSKFRLSQKQLLAPRQLDLSSPLLPTRLLASNFPPEMP